METLFMIFVLLALVYYIFRIIQVIVKLKQAHIFPLTNEERRTIRKHPQKITAPPTVEGQKLGLLANVAFLFFIASMFSIVYITDVFSWHQYLFMLFFLMYAYFMLPLNLVAVKQDGILIGTRFLSWKHIHSIKAVAIYKNHKFYGYSSDVNIGFVVKIKYKFGFTSFVVTSEKTLKQLLKICQEHVTVEDEIHTSESEFKIK
ncbi:hypothetical protein [Virgibacillus chiguensis]|uniref:DUF5673 domain-containing protein n=1 Tax=Virgibacillus chiguensis TaxID=411959 RepID=A0A1M5RIE4_9BACI|nr:hypothetical protein [Virgibacillus chiguensis]SHH26152.1 hypothetical protein SAMN05421807_105175 [Virgibacillus chiguensis]